VELLPPHERATRYGAVEVIEAPRWTKLIRRRDGGRGSRAARVAIIRCRAARDQRIAFVHYAAKVSVRYGSYDLKSSAGMLRMKRTWECCRIARITRW